MVREVFHAATVREKEGILRAYLGLTAREVRLRPAATKQAGGNSYEGPTEVYRLFEAADMLHDFGEAAAAEAQATAVLPKGLAWNQMVRSDLFARAIAARGDLHIDGKDVANPLAGLCLLDGIMDLPRLIDGAPDLASVRRKLAGFLNGRHGTIPRIAGAAVITDTSVRPRPVELGEVAFMLARLHDTFGRKGTFIVETNIVGRIALGLRSIDKAMHVLFTVDDVVDWSGVNAKLRSMASEILAARIESEWDVSLCDANLFDSSDGVPGYIPIDARPTGDVFPAFSGGGCQVNLRGVDTGARRSPKVLATITNGGVPIEVCAKPKETRCFSERWIRDLLAARSLNSESDMAAGLTGVAKKVSALPPGALYAIKRAGDWGQVEHCLRYNKIFMTADLLAATYAMFRGVGCVYVRIESSYVPVDFERAAFAMRRRTAPGSF